MAFDIESWKFSIKERLHNWKPEVELAGVNTLYGFLASMALAPVVQAAVAGDPINATLAMVGVAGAVGGNLLAEQVQRWQDKGGAPPAAETASFLLEKARGSVEIRQAFDALLLKLELSQMAQVGLSENDREWFRRELQQELRGVNSSIVIDASGQAGVALGHSAAAGAYGIAINGDVAHSLIAIYVQQAPQAPQADYEAALERYVRHLRTTRSILNLRGIRSFQPLSIELEHSYITLRALDPERTERALAATKGRARTAAIAQLLEKEQEKPLPLQQLLAKHKRLVVLGDPGSGKTTFLSYLTLSVARAIADDNLALLQARLGRWSQAPLPIALPLREFGRYLRNLPARKRIGPQPQWLLDYLREYYDGWNLQLPGDFFTHHLDAGRCLIMLDGLDEVADFNERVLVSEQVEAFVQRYGDNGNRFIITCRVRGYEGQARLGQKFMTSTLLPFTDDDIRQFANAWCLAVAAAQVQTADESVRQKASAEAEDLIQAIHASPKVRELASNPLLLTVIALVHERRAKLPERRSELYNECTEVLLGYRETGKEGEESKRLAHYTGTALQMDAGEKRAFLEPIALAMHEDNVREWEFEVIVSALAKQFQERGHAPADARDMGKDFLETLTVRSGLIQEVEQNMYGFLHLSFQEYLAARKIADTPKYIGDTLSHLDDSWWRETILLQAGHLSETGRSRVSELVKAILSAPGDPLDRLNFAGLCLVDVGRLKAEATLWDRVVGDLLAVLTGKEPPKRRAAAGVVLAKLGDPREGVGVSDGLPDILWSQVIPAVPFPMGNDKPAARYSDEQPRFQCTLIRQPYRISRYPVTVAQYQAFVKARGYEQRRFWTEAGWAWKEKGKISGPQTYRDPFQTPNHPQVGVSWYEAHAFCQWLADVTGLPIRLPSEAEWERAARHTDARLYPWGQDAPKLRCNMRDTGIGSTCAVGLFPDGDAVCGAADMSGNMWEWCRTKWLDTYERYEQQADDDPAGSERRVVRGGSWVDDEGFVRCAHRYWDVPDHRLDECGFRVVCSPCESGARA